MPETSEISNATDFSEQMMGSCLCRSIVVTIVDSDLFTTPRGHLCHCENCRKLSGSYVSSNLLLSDEKVRLEDQSGSLTKYTDTETESGTPAYRYFCSRCGTPVKTVTPLVPGMVFLKTGLFPRIPKPEAESFAIRRQEWDLVLPGLTSYKTRLFGEKM